VLGASAAAQLAVNQQLLHLQLMLAALMLLPLW
jgi:hypothetical protein